MAQHSRVSLGSALVLLVVLQCVLADDCKKGCQGSPGLLKLTPGTTYKYDYDGKIDIELSSAKDQKTSTGVKATVLLTQQADCSQVLRLQNVQIVGPDDKKRTGLPDIEKPIVLNNNNGALSESICAEPTENQNSLNLKRAIASFFQANNEKNNEIDVFGQCPVDISKSEDGEFVTLTKNKNLNKCAFRESITQNFLVSTFDINSEIHSSPILNSNLDSKQKIKAGVLDSATITENYLFVPFSVGQNGAKATVISKLTLIGTSNDVPTTKCEIPKSIIFENPHPVNAAKSNVASLMKKVTEISEKLGTNVVDTTGIQFIELVKLLRVSKKVDILSVYNQVRSGVGLNDKEAAKKIFLDAILIAGNGDTIEVAIELLKNKELGPTEEKQLYLGLSHARHVTENSIKTATDLINRANLPREAFLGVGALAGRYCATHNCENVEVVNKIIQKLLGKLGDLKAANRKEETDMIYVLKGLANIGYLNDAILAKLVSLAEDKKQPIRLRVATLETFAAAPCKDKLRDSALKTLKDINQDSEIRIKAYLALTKCPNDKIGNAIKSLLEQEKSNQVGGFISSHIKSLRSSANPDKELAKRHLGFIHTPNRFIFDPRRYSFNGEVSYAVDAIGAANNVEANVIYSYDSWLPRSSNLNLTAEVFGQRFNFLEIAVRQENLDKIVEHYLGPQGVLQKATLQQNWDHAAKPVEQLLNNLKEKLNKSLRSRRDVSQTDIDAINKKVQIKTSELDKNLDLDLSIKNFGSEILFMNSFEVTEKLSPQHVIDKLIAKLNEGLDKLKNFEEVFRSNLLILDAELSYPTSLGFPLRLGIDGSSNLQVKAAGNIDVRDLLGRSSDKDINFKLSLIPSATITIVGNFKLDTPLLENGLRVASTLHTSSGAELHVDTFKESLGIDAKLIFPVQKQELIGAKHDIIFQTRENGIESSKQHLKFSQNKDLSICVDQLVSYVGLELCADINGPNLSGKKVPILPFPLSGDAKASVRIERGDINTFHYRREFFTKKDGKVGVAATLETLDKNNNKAVSLDVEGFISPEQYIKAVLKSPIKNAEGEARLVLNDKEKLIAVTVKDEDILYSAKAGLRIDAGSDKTVYNPVLEYTTPDNNSPQTPPLHVEGKVIAEKKGEDVKYTLDKVKLVIPGQKSLTVDGNLGVEGSTFYTDLTATDGSISGTIKGRINSKPNHLKIDAELQNSLNPSINFKVKGDFKRQGDQHSSDILIVHGADLNSKTNVITLTNSFHMKNPKTLDLSTKNKFSYPLIKLNAKFDLEKGPKLFDYDTYVQYGDFKLGSELELKMHTKSHGDYHLDLEVFTLKDKVEVKSSRQVLGAHDSKIDNSLSFNGKKLEIIGKVKHHLKPNDINVAADLVIKTPNGKAPWKLNEGVKLNPKEIDLHLKLLSGSTPIIDALLKGNKAGNANGHLKVTFKDTLVINGQIKATKGAGNADLLIDAKSLKKSAKLESTFNIHSPTYNLDLNIFPLYNQDKSKKIALSTKNKYTYAHLDSASTLDLLGSKFALNVKALVGNPYNGKTSVDVDLTLPCKRYLAGKVVRDSSLKDGIWNSDSTVSIEVRKEKGSPGQKVSLKSNVKDTNFNKGILDITINLAADDSKGNNANVDLSLKRQKNGEKWTVNGANKISSSLLKNPIETTISSEYQDWNGNFAIKSSSGPKSSVKVDGKYVLQHEKNPISGSLAVDLVTPLEILSNLKATTAFSIKKPKGKSPVSIELSNSLSTVSSNNNLNIDTKSNVEINGSERSGNLKYHGEINKPIKTALDYSGSFEVDTDKKTGFIVSNLKAILPENKVVQASSTLSRVAPKEYKYDLSLDLPTETFKSTKLNIHSKRSDDNENIFSNSELTIDGKKYLGNTEICLNAKEPSIDSKLTYPDGKIVQFVANSKRPSDSKIVSNLKMQNDLKDYLVEGGLEVNYENLNNMYIQATANAPKLNVKNVFIKIGNAGGNDGKTLNIDITSDGKNIVSGSASVSSRDEQGKFIVEGSGNFKVNEESKSGNFKYIRTSLTSDKNGENGEEISFDASLGNKAIDAELKLTNKEFRCLYSYCEESKQCAHVEIDAKSNVESLARYDNELEITIDLRVLGIPNEFGLKAVTHRNNWQLDHTVDVHFENSANKYQYSLYVHPKEFGVSLTTPQRILAVEANAKIPTDVKNGGKTSAEVSFYTDKKNNPDKKTSLQGSLDVDVEKRSIDAEISLNYIGQDKPLSIKYNCVNPKLEWLTKRTEELVLDIFAKADQKIVITQTTTTDISKENYKIKAENILVIKSAGLGIDIDVKDSADFDPKALTGSFEGSLIINIGQKKYDSTLQLKASPKEFYFLSRHLNLVLLEVKSDISLQKGLINVNTHTSGIAIKPLESSLEIKNYNTLKYTQYLKSDPDNKLLISAALIPGQIADARAEFQAGSTKKEIFHASVSLDDKNFLHPDVAVNSENLKACSSKIKDIVIEQVKDTAQKIEEGNKNVQEDLKGLAQNFKETVPDTSKASQFYESEWSKLKDELAADKTLQELRECLDKFIEAASKVILVVVKNASEIFEKVAASINAAFSSIIKTIQEDLLPKVKEIAKQLISTLQVAFDKISEVIFTYIAKVAEILEVLQPHFKAIAVSLNEISEEIGRFLVKTYEHIKAVVKEQMKHLQDELKASPIFAEIKAQYEDFIKNGLPSKEVVVNTIKSITGAIKEAVLVPEFQHVIDLIEQYLEKKITNKPVDDIAELEKIGSTFVEAVSKFVTALSKEAVPDAVRNYRIPSLNFDLLKRLPSPDGAIRFSGWNYLFREDNTPVLRFLINLILRPEDFIIPSPRTAILSAKEIYTFDKKPYFFPGSCSYLAARDALNGNFSLFANYENNLLSGVTLSDKSGTVTVKDGKVILNNADADYPIHKGTLHAYHFQQFIEVKSDAGVSVKCELEIVKGCAVEVSGYYHGQLRGLLGNGNNEEFDDAILPNGKVGSVAELAPAYAASSGGACQPVAATDEKPKPNDKCDSTYGWDSSLSPCFPFVDRSKVKQMCEYAAAYPYADFEKINALHYSYLCFKSKIPVSPPKEYVTICKNSLTEKKLDEPFEVKLPGNAADVLLLINVNKNNEVLYKEYVQPLIGELVNEYKARGISDVEFNIIVYGGENKGPTQVTVGGKVSFKDKAPNLKFSEGSKAAKLTTGAVDVDKAILLIRTALHELRLFAEFYVTSIDAASYPFRAEAVRSVLVVTDNACEVGGTLPLELISALLPSKKEININAITPVNDLKVKDGKTTKDVIGFNQENVITLAESKTKPTGSPALLKDLSYSDSCSSFTLNNGGTVFVAENLISNKASKQEIAQVIAKNIVSQSLSKEIQLECNCELSFASFVPFNRCSVVNVKDK